jgi:hypothetical protein
LRQFFSRTNTAGILAISTTLFGLMYVPWLLNFFQKINFFPAWHGHYYLLYFIVNYQVQRHRSVPGRII